MEQLTLEQAANYEPPIPECYENGEIIAYTDGHQKGFVVGGNWQKEQDKLLIKALQDAIKFIKCSPFLSNPEKRPKGLEKWEALIERLQD